MAAARQAGIPLTLFGTVEDPAYWQAEVAPLLGGGIRYGGHLRAAALAAELGRASLFLFTPCWDEPFGLVAIEAMACGLPVASLDRGAAREVIAEAGVFAAPDDADALARAIPAALAIDRRVPRDRVMAAVHARPLAGWLRAPLRRGARGCGSHQPGSRATMTSFVTAVTLTGWP